MDCFSYSKKILIHMSVIEKTGMQKLIWQNILNNEIPLLFYKQMADIRKMSTIEGKSAQAKISFI